MTLNVLSNYERNWSSRAAAAEASTNSEEEASSTSNNSKKRSRSLSSDPDDGVVQQIQAESSYLLLSHTPSSIGGHHHHKNDLHNTNNNSIHRTGRWSKEEIAFVDALVVLFDSSSLPLPHGVKLNDFLQDMLLCKGSRLTKKMKNAKLSARSYTLNNNNATNSGSLIDPSSLTTLQDKFLTSIASEPTQLELKFNMRKLWRMHFMNLCLQVGYDGLDASDWIKSLEDMESRATLAEEFIRKARRRRMSLALKNDTGAHVERGVFVAGIPARTTTTSTTITTSSTTQEQPVVKKDRCMSIMSEITDENPSFLEEDAEFLAALELTVNDSRQRLFSEDYTMEFEALAADPLMSSPNEKPATATPPAPCLGDCGSFLEEVVGLMESKNVPFQHVDIWVPSYVSSDGESAAARSNNNGNSGKLRLFHAGHATRLDLDPTLGRQLNEYGVYSTHFSFAPGVGLPGRIYVKGEASWETGVHNADPKMFERAGGAKVYGVKTALGIPVEAPGIGRIVVAMYSTEEMEDDFVTKEVIMKEISKWTPEPKWKLVIELGDSPAAQDETNNDDESNKETTATAKSVELDFFSHSMQPGGSTVPPPPPPLRGALKTEPTVESGLMHYSHAPPSSTTMFFDAAPVSDLVASDAKKTASAKMDLTEGDDDVEQKIASLLGDHMPVGVGDPASQELVPHFMSLRLLLLSSEERRTPEEKEKLEIIKKSYHGFSKDNKRSGPELASLIAKDWMYLNQVKPSSASSQQQQPQYQSHLMAVPAMETMSRFGVPSVMPPSLGDPLQQQPHIHANPVSFSSVASMDRSGARERALLVDDSALVSPRSRSVSTSSNISSANIVPET